MLYSLTRLSAGLSEKFELSVSNFYGSKATKLNQIVSWLNLFNQA